MWLWIVCEKPSLAGGPSKEGGNKGGRRSGTCWRADVKHRLTEARNTANAGSRERGGWRGLPDRGGLNLVCAAVMV